MLFQKNAPVKIEQIRGKREIKDEKERREKKSETKSIYHKNAFIAILSYGLVA